MPMIITHFNRELLLFRRLKEILKEKCEAIVQNHLPLFQHRSLFGNDYITGFGLDRSCMAEGGMHPGVLRLTLEALKY